MNDTRTTFSKSIHVLGLAILLFAAASAAAQSTEFTFQGSLKDGANAANGNYDFEFLLYDSLAGGTQLGSSLSRNVVPVSAGVFSVKLDFGDQFPAGADRWLEIRVRTSGAGAFTTLSPRSPVGSTPYAVRSLTANTANAMSATCIGCINAGNIASVNGAAVSGAIPVASVPAGSANYIQNTTSMQPNSNFYITGDGILGGRLSSGTVNAINRFELAGSRVLSLATDGLFVGIEAGANNIGALNTFVGHHAGRVNVNGAANSFFGAFAGKNMVDGTSNSFFGRNAGATNTGGSFNAYFGAEAGASGSVGQNNSYFGASAGRQNVGSHNAFFGAGAGGAPSGGSGIAIFGASAGAFNIAGENSFFGAYAAALNTTGIYNSFFGYEAGAANTTTCCNSFFGNRAGRNSTGVTNTFIGNRAGETNTSGSNNTIVGGFAAPELTVGSGNSFFGRSAGGGVINGNNNTYVGYETGQTDTFRGGNTAVGYKAKVVGDNSTAIGAYAFAETFDALVLGGIAGVNGANFNTRVGIGTTMPGARLHVRDDGGNTFVGNLGCNPGFAGISFSLANCNSYSILGDGNDTIINRSAGGVIQFREANGAQITINAGGTLSINALGSAGSTQLCRNASNTISTCSSSLRYKTNISRYVNGMSFISRLRPIAFDWKEDGVKDVGFGAEDIAKIDPRFVTFNDRGEVEGVKYDRLSVVFVNALKQQQAEIEGLRAQLDALKRIVCASQPDASICKEER